jgi:hypothetical protein
LRLPVTVPGSSGTTPEAQQRAGEKIEDLHKQLEQNVSKIPMTGVKDGALIDMFQAEMGRKHGEKPACAFSKIEEQTRYYRVKYYFDVSQV